MNRSSSNYPACIYLLLFCTGVVYCCTMPLKHGLGDALNEIAIATSPNPEIRPHHLLTSVWNHVVLCITAFTGQPHIRLQVMMVLAGLIAGYFLYLLLLRLTKRSSIALLFTGLFLFSNGIWIHSTVVETGIIPLALLIASLYLLMNNVLTMRSCVLGSALFGASLLFNIQYAMLLPLVVFLVWIQAESKRKVYLSLASGMAILMIAGAPYVLLPYTLGMVSSFDEYIAWLTSHPNQRALLHLSHNIVGSLRGASGFITLLVNTEGATSILKLFLRGDAVVIGPMLLLRLCVAGFVAAGFILLGIRGSHGRKGIVVVCWLSILTIYLFSLFWLGSDPQFWIPAYPFLLILAARGVAQIQSRSSIGVILGSGIIALIGLAIMNIPSGPPSVLFPRGGQIYQHAISAVESGEIDRNTLVITAAGQWAGYLKQIRSDVAPLDLTQEESRGGKALLDNLVPIIDRVLRSGGAVFFEGLNGPLPPERTGPWEIVHTLHQIDRQELRECLLEQYDLVSMPDFEKLGLVRIRPMQP